jgi:uncharacterized protein
VAHASGPQPLPGNDDAAIAAFDDVCRQLAGFDARLSTEWVDGYLSALVAGPRAVEITDWLEPLCGDAFGRAFADPADVERATRALLGRWNGIAADLDPEALDAHPDALRLRPVLMTADDGDDAAAMAHVSGASWASGFLQARDDFAEDWQLPPRVGPDDAAHMRNCMRVIEALTLDGDALEAFKREMFPRHTLDRDDLVDEACFAVQELRMFWIDHAPRPAPRRVEATPGRNDPCPCGSGRKYKKCHGAPAG